jgi:hypothetical protein
LGGWLPSRLYSPCLRLRRCGGSPAKVGITSVTAVPPSARMSPPRPLEPGLCRSERLPFQLAGHKTHLS